jgi:hypothetical protein
LIENYDKMKIMHYGDPVGETKSKLGNHSLTATRLPFYSALLAMLGKADWRRRLSLSPQNRHAYGCPRLASIRIRSQGCGKPVNYDICSTMME